MCVLSLFKRQTFLYLHAAYTSKTNNSSYKNDKRKRKEKKKKPTYPFETLTKKCFFHTKDQSVNHK